MFEKEESNTSKSSKLKQSGNIKNQVRSMKEADSTTDIEKIQMNSNFFTRANVIQLQGTIGNRAVMQFLENNRGINTNSKPVLQKMDVAENNNNNNGMPDNLRSGVENLSGLSMNDIKVHYNSSKPAEVGALAYTTGKDIHVAPGQEKHLPHEAWHVVQQAMGRVKPTIQMKGLDLNDDVGLEKEADAMGRRSATQSWKQQCVPIPKTRTNAGSELIQRMKSEDVVAEVAELDNQNVPSLIYGLNLNRNEVTDHDDLENKSKYDGLRTIDSYNTEVGIGECMKATTAATGIFKVRDALAGDWNDNLPSKNKVATTPNSGHPLREWVDFLKQNTAEVGLYDLAEEPEALSGDLPSESKIKDNGVFEENHMNESESKSLPAEDISSWLNSSSTTEDAAKDGDIKSPILHKWIYKAFFRRTSKLGIDFMIAQKGKIYFNTDAAPDYDKSKGENAKQNQHKAGGFKTISDKYADQSKRGEKIYNKPITVSEYEYAQEKIKDGSLNTDNYKEYSDIKKKGLFSCCK